MIEFSKSIVIREKFPLALRIEQTKAIILKEKAPQISFSRGKYVTPQMMKALDAMEGGGVGRSFSEDETKKTWSKIRHDVGPMRMLAAFQIVYGHMGEFEHGLYSKCLNEYEKIKNDFLNTFNTIMPRKMLSGNELRTFKEVLSKVYDDYYFAFEGSFSRLNGLSQNDVTNSKMEEAFEDDLTDIRKRKDFCMMLLEDFYSFDVRSKRSFVWLIEQAIEKSNKFNTQVSFAEDMKKTETLCNPGKLISTIYNVINNAYEAGAKDVNVELVFNESRDIAVIVINDNGGGIKKELLCNTLDLDTGEARQALFHKGVTTKTHETGEHGIGLDSCYEAVREHGGTIVARNNDVGAEFIIRIPISI